MFLIHCCLRSMHMGGGIDVRLRLGVLDSRGVVVIDWAAGYRREYGYGYLTLRFWEGITAAGIASIGVWDSG